jgi:hypothetical protein
MPSAEFEPKIPTSERLQTQALNRTDTGIDIKVNKHVKSIYF